MRAPTLWEGFGNNAREVSQTRAVCCRLASDSAVLRVSRAMHVVTAVLREISTRKRSPLQDGSRQEGREAPGETGGYTVFSPGTCHGGSGERRVGEERRSRWGA